ncbi:uncharacterized protein F5147DRAFT_775225 [Suillus discolor]|uniref:Uncharacterized protein n=1 Tax=Suillus discolor TaxID=1912936 RepID=A0A9P7F4B8_9AGAM|nr:uncharacterized protein F5147DRAFT_775225 [Suillus discolor]KAG2105457.1 hypothetical protein F5147DRAFT_775225 [Suillus discolor]
MSSTIFNPSMLTASPSPSPSPEPEEHPLEGGDASVDDATLDDAAPKEPEESESDRVEHAWAAMLNTMHVCVDTAPPSKPEPLEEQESWLHDWNVMMSNMTVVYEQACAASLHMSLNDVDAVTLAEGKIAARTLTRAVKAWKEKAEESAVTARLARADKGKAFGWADDRDLQSIVPLSIVNAAPHPAPSASSCMRAGDVKGISRHGKAVRSVIAAKNKGRALAAPKRKALPSVQTTAPDAGESEVEIVGEATADEPAAGPSKDIVMQHPKRVLNSGAVPAAKHPRLEADPKLEEARMEAVRLRAKNAKLCAQNDKYRLALIDMRQHTCTQESELLHMSNQLYILAHDWGNWEKELGEILED